MPHLRSLILSQNKIIERKHKILIEKLRKLDLNVSVWLLSYDIWYIESMLFGIILILINHALDCY